MASNTASVSKLDTSKDAADDVREQLTALREDLAGLKTAMAAYAKDRADAAQATAASGAEALRDAGKAGLKSAGDFAGNVRAEAEAHVRENPGTALAIAAGIGFLLGVLTRKS